MFNVDKQIAYWQQGAIEDWQVAEDLLVQGRYRHGLFFAELALEKLIKALVCKKTNDLAPRIHSLVRLAELADIALPPDFETALADLSAFNIEGRYPDTLIPAPTADDAKKFHKIAEDIFKWLIGQL
jgi:HEPN domain-containing protein